MTLDDMCAASSDIQPCHYVLTMQSGPECWFDAWSPEVFIATDHKNAHYDGTLELNFTIFANHEKVVNENV